MKKLAIMFAVMVLVATNAWAFRGEGGMGPGPGGCGMGPGFWVNSSIVSKLNLTEEQQAQIKAKREVFMGEIDPLRDKLFSKKTELRNLWAKADPDQTAITEKQHEIQAIQSEMQEKSTQFHFDCRRLLTPEQQEKLAALIAKGGCRGARGMGGGRGRQMHGW